MKSALGRGLDSLIPQGGPSRAQSASVTEIDIERIAANSEQPRKKFQDKALSELAESIKENGVIQPIIVRRGQGGGSFILVAGERRWRAAQKAGLKKIPALIKDLSDESALEIALIENIQREDLSPLETAIAFQKLINDFKLKQEELSKKVSKDRATISNYLRLLTLPVTIKEFIEEGSLSMGHAKALLSLDGKTEQIKAARTIVDKGLSVREAEALAKDHKKSGQKTSASSKSPSSEELQIASLENRLTKNLGAKVKIKQKGKGGCVEITYQDTDDLNRLLDMLI